MPNVLFFKFASEYRSSHFESFEAQLLHHYGRLLSDHRIATSRTRSESITDAIAIEQPLSAVVSISLIASLLTI